MVTATRRAETTQDLGLAVTAFSGEQLRDQNAVRFEDVAVQTPGLQFTAVGGTALVGLVSIRGVAQNDFAAHLESASAIYVDDVYRPSNAANIQNLFDIARVEVIKGPQGTLFGRNATGGLIHFVTEDPGQEFEGSIEAGYGEFNEITLQAVVNAPISEKVAARLAVSHRSHDGWIENSIGPDSVEDDTLGVRAKLLIEPTESLRIKLTAEHYDVDDINAGGGFPRGGFVGPDTLGRYRPSGSTDANYVDEDGDIFTGAFDFAGNYGRNQLDLASDIRYSWDSYELTWISSYSEFEVDYSEDNDLTPFDITVFVQDTEQESFSQELRLNADFDALRITTGIYYLDIDGEYFQGFSINNLGGGGESQIAPGAPPFLLPVGINQAADYTLETRSWSLFGQAEFDISERLTATVGFRYTEDEKDYNYVSVCPTTPACIGTTFDPITIAGNSPVSDSHDENGISARLQFDYAVSEGILLYASYNRGYKAFSYNAGFAGAAPLENVRFDGEFLDAYEVGAKLDFWDDKARLNVAAFYYDYDDYQAFDQRGTDFFLFNTVATIYGSDAELLLNPGYGVNLRLGLALLETEVEDIPIAGELLTREAPQSPDLSFNFAATKDFGLADGVLRLGLDGSYSDEYFSQLTNAPVTLIENGWILNARATWTSPNAQWQGSLFVRNLLDAEQQNYAFDITFPGNGLVEQNFYPPQWFGGSIRFAF